MGQIKSKKGFTLIEILLAVGLMALISVVSVRIVANLVKSAVKSQSSVDVEQSSNFVLTKLEDDIAKSYSASSTATTLTLLQGSSVSPKTVTYKIKANCNAVSVPPLNCITTNHGLGDIKITDDTSVGAVPTLSAVTIDTANSNFSVVGSPTAAAVNVKITFNKPTVASTKIFDAQFVLDTTIVLRGSN